MTAGPPTLVLSYTQKKEHHPNHTWEKLRTGFFYIRQRKEEANQCGLNVCGLCVGRSFHTRSGFWNIFFLLFFFCACSLEGGYRINAVPVTADDRKQEKMSCVMFWFYIFIEMLSWITHLEQVENKGGKGVIVGYGIILGWRMNSSGERECVENGVCLAVVLTRSRKFGNYFGMLWDFR